MTLNASGPTLLFSTEFIVAYLPVSCKNFSSKGILVNSRKRTCNRKWKMFTDRPIKEKGELSMKEKCVGSRIRHGMTFLVLFFAVCCMALLSGG